MINKKFIKNFCIKENKKVIDAIHLFDKSKTNILLVINNKNKFKGIITSTDLRRGIIKGLSNNSSLMHIVNKNPLYLKEKIDENKISNILSSNRFNEIDPPYIPIVDKNNIPKRIVKKEFLNLNLISNNKDRQNTVLLIGGAGYIGSILAKYLLKNKFKVTIFDKFIYQSQKELKAKIKSKNLKLIKGDSRDISQIFGVIKKNNIIIHLAELVGDPLCEVRPSKTYEINFLASIAISNICKNLPVSKFIYISSCSIYGSNDKILTERSRIKPLSVYAKLKALCEKTIIRNSGEFCKPCILRLGTVYGNSLRPRFDLVINLFASKVANNQPIQVTGGEQWRPFIHVAEVADAIIKIIKLEDHKVNGQIFNLTSFNSKIIDIAKSFKKIFPNTKLIIKKSSKDKRNYKVSSDKAKKLLNFKPNIKFKNGIINMVSFIKKNKIKNINKKKYLNILNSSKF